MKRLTIDFERSRVMVDTGEGKPAEYPFEEARAFALVSDAWLRIGWDVKYVYTFTWLGRPIIQLPEDLIRVQEVIHRVKPDVIIETGVAHGGSLVFYASLCRAAGKGRVIGIDVEIRPDNRAALESHQLFPLITLVEGSSVDPAVVERVRRLVGDGETVFVMLDAKHTKQHVLAELHYYAPLVSPGSYIVVADGIMESLVGAPRSSHDWAWNNPRAAAEEFVKARPDFVIEEPAFAFNEGLVTNRVTYWPRAFLRRISA
jgi:cephalosporin hydroxylase